MKFKKYVFRSYNKEYPNLFKREKRKLKKILGSEAVIEHVGSTSIPCLGGKGIIDIAIKTQKKNLKQHRVGLKMLKYEYTPEHREDKRRIFFQKKIKYNKKERRVHIHLTLTNKFWNTFIIFRDKLRKNPGLIKEYAKIKKKAVKFAKGEGQKYREYKDKFLKKHSK